MTITPFFDPSQFPAELLDFPNFVAWRTEVRQGKPTKVPVNPRTGRLALSNVASTWATFEEALPFARSEGLGIGFVFSAGDPFAGVDLDDCIEAEARRVKPWAWEIICGLASYTEVSPSGLGAKIIIRAKLPTGRRGWGKGHGMYDTCRFFTLTGARFPTLPPTVEGRQPEIEALHAKLFPPAPPAQSGAAPIPLRNWSDAEIVQKAMSAANGVKFSDLWLGGDGDHTSPSEADASLCSMLAFWTGPDPERIAGLYRQSGRYQDEIRRRKWERASYRDKTIALAMKRGTYYTPRTTHTPRQALSFDKRPA